MTPAAIEQAVSRTSAQYMGDLRTMLAEVGKVYEGQLAAKNAALEAKDQALTSQGAALAAKDETIAELRRRAETAEAERDSLRQARDARRERAREHVLEQQRLGRARRSGSMTPAVLDRLADELERRDTAPAPPSRPPIVPPPLARMPPGRRWHGRTPRTMVGLVGVVRPPRRRRRADDGGRPATARAAE